jgi:hypothetical protein
VPVEQRVEVAHHPGRRLLSGRVGERVLQPLKPLLHHLLAQLVEDLLVQLAASSLAQL